MDLLLLGPKPSVLPMNYTPIFNLYILLLLTPELKLIEVKVKVDYNELVPILAYILLFNFLGSVVSLFGGALLFVNEKVTLKYSHLLASFAAGSLLAAAFFDLLPEASREAGKDGVDVFLWTLLGFLFFFLLERFIHWFHHHGHEDVGRDAKPIVPLIVLGDSIHNFIDGIAIASTFIVSVPLGIVTTFAVAAHEIPQEIGDFGLLLHKKVAKKNVFLINFASALTSIIGAVLAYFVGGKIEGLVPIFLALTAGFFIYIASADLIPEIHHENRRGFAFYESLLLLAGVFVIWLTISLLSGFSV